MSMKVLHVIPSLGPVRGGPTKSVLGMVKALNHHGIHADLVTTNDNGPDLLNVPLQQLINHEGVPVRFFPRFSPPIAAISEYSFSSPLAQWLWHHIESYSLVHVHAIFSYPSTLAMIIAQIKGVPYIIRPPGQLCQWALGHRGLKKKVYLNLIEKANLNCSQAIHFASDKEQTESASLGLKPPSFVLPHGITLAKPIANARLALGQRLGLPDDEPIVLFMGRLHTVKGLDYLIPALGKIANQRFSFVLAGSGESNYEAHVQQMITDAGIRGRTHSLGFVTGSFKDLLLQGSDIFTVTSHQENFGVAALEAMSTGLAVITTPGVALSSMIQQQEAGYVCDLDSDAIAKAIQYCLTHSQLAKARGQHAVNIVNRHYTWEAHAAKLSNIYHQVLQQDRLTLNTALEEIKLPM